MALRPKTDEDRASAKQRREAAQSDVLIREIDDAVRQDRYGEVATRYGKPLLALLVVALLALGGYMLWHNRQEAALEADSEALVGALDQLEAGNLDSGDSALDAVIADADGAAATSALMLKGGVAMERGNGADAARIFGEVANDARAPQPLRDLALIRQVSARFDELPPAQVVQQLGSLARPGNAFFGSAGELVAMAQLKQGKQQEAGRLFAAIAKDEDVPESIRGRTRQMAGLLGVDAITDVDALLEAEGVSRDARDAADAPRGTE